MLDLLDLGLWWGIVFGIGIGTLAWGLVKAINVIAYLMRH